MGTRQFRNLLILTVRFRVQAPRKIIYMGTCERAGCENSTKTKTARFCSLSCANSGPRESIRKNKKRICSSCGKEFDRKDTKQKYCSRSCSAKETNVARKTIKNCLVCGNSLGKGRIKFCCKEHQTAFRKNERINAWLSGEWSGSVLSGLSAVISLYLKEQAGWRCQSPTCAYPGGWSEINLGTGKVPIQIDHIDGDASNNRPENLIVLCPSCHSLTPTYGALNKTSTRTYRKKYYNKATVAQSGRADTL